MRTWLVSGGIGRDGRQEAVASLGQRLDEARGAGVVAEGEAEVGMQQIVAILPVKGAELVGPLPSELQNIIVYAAGLSPVAAQSGAARTFIAFLGMPEVQQLIRAKGMEPG